MSYQTFKVQFFKQETIAKVTISRPKSLNAMSPKFFEQISTIFKSFNTHPTVRVAILIGEGRIFTAGLDLKQYGSMFGSDISDQDPARVSIALYQVVKSLQAPFLNVFNCRVPVLVGIHNKCIGGGVDLASLCDIRYCTSDAEFTIKEIDIGMAADIGTLQAFPNVIGSQSTFRELAYTGRALKAEQALKIGFVSKVLPNKEVLEQSLMETAENIASKSPVGIYALKQVIQRQFGENIVKNLEYQARFNSSMLLTKDMAEAVMATLQKRPATFPKL